MHHAVDLRRVAARAPFGDRPAGVRLRPATRADLVDDHLLARADLALEAPHRDCLLATHQAMPALLLHCVGDGGRKLVDARTRHRLITETADAFELGLFEPVEQKAEVRFALAGKADDEGGADAEIGADLAPARGAARWLFLCRRAAHPPQHFGRGMLDGDGE